MSLDTQKYINNFSTTLQAIVAGGDVTISIPAAQSALLGAIAANEYFVGTMSDGSSLEVIWITGNNLSGTLTIERSKEGTSAISYAVGDAIECRTTKGTLETLRDHAARHIAGAADEIDGDQIDIDFTPTNYTPDTTPAEASSVDHLSAHLAGIDDFLGYTNIMSAYGVRWTTNTSSPIMTKGIVAGGVFVPFAYTEHPIQAQMKRCVTDASLALKYYLKESDSTKKADGTDANIDGTDGQAMVQTRKFECLDVTDGNYRYLIVGWQPFYLTKSDSSVVQSIVHPWFWEGGVLADHRYMSAFEGVLYDDAGEDYADGTGSSLYASGDKIHSVAGYIPMTYISRAEMRVACAVDSPYHAHGYWGDHAIMMLYLTEYATWNSQLALPGYTGGGGWDLTKRCKTGITQTLGNASGSISWGDANSGLRCTYDFSGTPTVIVANSFRGIENPFGHLWKWVDGVNFEFIGDPLTDAKIYICNNPADWAEDTATGYDDLGLDLPLTSGYQSALHPGTFLPSSVAGGGSDTFITDYYYASAAAGWRALWSGGALDGGAAGGFAFRLAYNAGSTRSADFGGRSEA